MKTKSGFTLVELIVVIAIIAVITAVAVPNLISFVPNYRLNQGMEELQVNLQMSRLQAVKENANVVLQFDKANETYVAFVDDGAAGTGTAGDSVQNGNEKTVVSATLPDGIDLIDTTFTGERLRFNSRGLISGLSGTVQLTNGKRYRGVRVLITGIPVLVQSTDGGTTWNQM